ncbi:MAG: cupin domain-containing protein [Chloroflexi bacterium]|nr:cupin domain-containing protein [Chloroflexota bacterium]MDA1002857.1 cupin domain-containing protein [Chloroflexota bacterium]
MVEPIRAFVVTAEGGERIRGPVGGPSTIKARTEATGGTFCFLENVIPPGEGPPLHSHAREDEMWFVREGHLRFIADGELFDAPTGAFVFVPRRTPHCFQNIGEVPAVVMVMFTPGGMERFFELHAALPAGPGRSRGVPRDRGTLLDGGSRPAARTVAPPLARSRGAGPCAREALARRVAACRTPSADR